MASVCFFSVVKVQILSQTFYALTDKTKISLMAIEEEFYQMNVFYGLVC